MIFEINHATEYAYGQPAAEAYLETRLSPPSLPSQEILSHALVIDPLTATSGYRDHHDNHVEFFSLPFRHTRLRLRSRNLVRTRPVALPEESLEVTLIETRQILRSQLSDFYAYLQFTDVVPRVPQSLAWAKRHLRGNRPLGEALQELNSAIHEHFAYKSGSTENSTPLATVWKQQRGVCQDFAHVLLSILRSAFLPARYVCGYIESGTPAQHAGETALVGSIATHAWVEVLLAGRVWAALDPTNNQWCGERHVTVSYGKDFRSAAPVRGTFKGAGGQQMSVKVTMRRRVERTVPLGK